jgi:hypothetical protein
MQNDKSFKPDRRRALRGLATGPAIAAVAVVAGQAQAAEVRVEKPATPARSQGYHETQHIRDYYRTAGF